MKNRLEELDSLRGVAAITVVLNHIFNVLPAFYNSGNSVYLDILKFTPLHVLWAGHEAVMLFFVLSGFVLALPFLKGNNINYPRFLFKRICRIYIPYIIAVLAAIFFNKMFSRNGISELSAWFNIAWTDDLTTSSIVNHLIMIGDYKNFQYNPVIWSLIHELRISLIFPFLMIIVLKLTWKKSIFISLLITFFSFIAIKISEKYLGYVNYGSSIMDSFYYSSMFIIGAVLAKYLKELKECIKKHQKWKPFLFIMSLLCYTYSWWFFPNVNFFHLRLINEWVTVIGVVIIILLSLTSIKFSLLLRTKPCRFLGEISYSLYLWHAVTLLTFVNLWYGKIPLGYLLLTAGLTSIVIATISFRFIEKTSINIGNIKLKNFKEQKQIAR